MITVLFLFIEKVAFAHSEESTICIKTHTKIVIDGDLRDWARRVDKSDWSALLNIKKGQMGNLMKAVPTYINILTSNVETGKIDSPQDYSAIFYTLWDDDNIYLAFIVIDDELIPEKEDENIWQDDCIEVWFDTRHDAVTAEMFQEDEYQIGLTAFVEKKQQALKWVWRNPYSEEVREKIQVASVIFEGGYVIEAAIPIKAMRGLAPQECKYVGFNVSGVDKDKDGVWTHITWSGKLHSDPTQFGHLYFMEEPIDIFLSDVKKVGD